VLKSFAPGRLAYLGALLRGEAHLPLLHLTLGAAPEGIVKLGHVMLDNGLPLALCKPASTERWAKQVGTGAACSTILRPRAQIIRTLSPAVWEFLNRHAVAGGSECVGDVGGCYSCHLFVKLKVRSTPSTNKCVCRFGMPCK
jgi:hypothetical protein